MDEYDIIKHPGDLKVSHYNEFWNKEGHLNTSELELQKMNQFYKDIKDKI